MKNVFFALAFMLVGTFAFANTSNPEIKNSETVEVNETKTEYTQIFLFDEVVGTCHITIYNTRTGETVYQISLPANTPEACNQMAQDTLDAFVEGNL